MFVLLRVRDSCHQPSTKGLETYMGLLPLSDRLPFYIFLPTRAIYIQYFVAMYKLSCTVAKSAKSTLQRAASHRSCNGNNGFLHPSSSLTRLLAPSLSSSHAMSIRHLFTAKNEEYSSLEYPDAKEPPEITKTIASQVRGQTPKHIPKPESGIPPPPSSLLPDDNEEGPPVTEEWIASLRKRSLSPGVSKITATVPETIPSNVPADQLETPETIITTLDNGIRVVR